MTEYVCTRWYRAPEVLCSWTDYSAAIDMWSIGCIATELLTRKPLFPGSNTQQQLDMIITVLGPPQGEELSKIKNMKCQRFIKSLPEREPKIKAMFENECLLMQDFLDKTLCWDPDARLTAEQALAHGYLDAFHCDEDEPTSGSLPSIDFEFERRKVNSACLREEIFEEALHYYPDLRHQIKEPEDGKGHNIMDYPVLMPGESLESDDSSDG